MKQSNKIIEILNLMDLVSIRNVLDPAKVAALYVRLSRDDNLEGDSYSVVNQKKLLMEVAKSKGYTYLLIFCDDGISGVTMNRPGYQLMLQAVEQHTVSAVFVKDLSRLGRNYIEVGKLTEEVFPEHNIRLIAVSDNLDTDEGDSELTPIKNLFNEWYARDISKKRRLSNKIKGNAGEPMGQPPFGYMKDTDDPKRWVIDEEAAAVVRRIFSMTTDGYGTEQIAVALTKDYILSPLFYWRSKGINRAGKVPDREPHRWNSSSVIKILSLQEYCGDVINFKTYSKSYKNKKRIENDPDNWAIFKGVHDPIIEREVWEQVQSKRGKVRKRIQHDGEKSMFSGLLICADCGGNLNFHFNQKNHAIQYFNCANNNRSLKTCDKTHYVRVDFLEQVVLGEIRRLTQFASRYENDFVKAVVGHSQQAATERQKEKQQKVKTLQNREAELDNLFVRIYEDNASGKITDERFSKLSAKYETEQADISERLKELKAELGKETDKSMSTDMFIAIVRKYTRAKKLTQRMLNELVDYIEVHHAEKIDGVHAQKLIIHYNCVGTVEIPNVLPLPLPEVTIQTRKGVAVSYSQSQQAVVNF